MMNFLDQSIDDLDDFKITSVKSRKAKIKAKKCKATETVPASFNTKKWPCLTKADNVFKSNSPNVQEDKDDTKLPCLTCSRVFQTVELLEHTQHCEELNMRVAKGVLECKPKEIINKKICPICNKVFANFDEARLNWHINKCLDHENPEALTTCHENEPTTRLKDKPVSKTKDKPVQKRLFNVKGIKVPKSKFAENLLIAKSLSASEVQIKKDAVKRLKKLKKEPKVPKMLQYSPKTVLRTKQQAVEKCIMRTIALTDECEVQETLPLFTNKISCVKRLALSLSYELTDLEKVSSLSFTCFDSLSKIDYEVDK